MSGKGFSDADRAKALETQHRNREEKKQGFPAALLKCNGNLYRACRMCDVSRRQYYTWRKEDPEFERLTDEAWSSVIDDLESLLVDIAHGTKKGNFGAACAVLNARARDRGYGVSRQEHSGVGGGPVTFKVVYEEEKVEKEDGS